MDHRPIFEQGIDSASRAYAIGENLLIILTVAVGFLGMMPLLNIAGIPVLSILYASLLLVSLGFLLRKHLCTHCHYYGKWCHCGWGILAAKLGYTRGSGNKALGVKLGGATWGTLMVVPLLAMIVGFVLHGISLGGGVLFGGFVALALLNFGLHVKDCKECKMRHVCGMSAAKK